MSNGGGGSNGSFGQSTYTTAQASSYTTDSLVLLELEFLWTGTFSDMFNHILSSGGLHTLIGMGELSVFYSTYKSEPSENCHTYSLSEEWLTCLLALTYPTMLQSILVRIQVVVLYEYSSFIIVNISSNLYA